MKTNPHARVIRAAKGETKAAFTITTNHNRWLNDTDVPLPSVALDGFRSANLQIVGVPTTTGATADIRVYARRTGGEPAGQASTSRQRVYLGTIAATWNTTTAVGDGSVVLSDEVIADQLSWTPSSAATTPPGPMTDSAAAMLESPGGAFSPGSGVPAEVILQHMAFCSTLEFDIKCNANCSRLNILAASALY